MRGMSRAAGVLMFMAVVVSFGETMRATPGPEELPPIGSRPPAQLPADGQIQVFDCGGLSRVVVRLFPQAVDVSLPGRHATLPRSVDAPDERYSDGRVTFWSAGNYARIEDPDGMHFCRNSPAEVPWEDAQSRGIEVRAAGQEPEWSLEINEGTGFEFVADSGATRFATSAPLPEVDPSLERTTYNAKADGHSLRVVLEHRLCWYEANSIASSATVTVTVDANRIYRGCGRPLSSGVLTGTIVHPGPVMLPVGSELRVRLVNLSGGSSTREVIGEQRAVIESQAPIRFEIKYDQARIYGGDAYGIEATVRVSARSRWATRKVYPVLTRGSIGFVEVLLEPVP